MLFGYAGKIGWVDLTSGEIRHEDLKEDIARKFIGGKGLGAHGLLTPLKIASAPASAVILHDITSN